MLINIAVIVKKKSQVHNSERSRRKRSHCFYQLSVDEVNWQSSSSHVHKNSDQ